MEPDQLLGGLMILFLVLLMAKFVSAAEKAAKQAQDSKEAKAPEQPQKVHSFSNPCYTYGKPHKWEYLQITNQFGEMVWIHKCIQCNRKPGEM